MRCRKVSSKPPKLSRFSLDEKERRVRERVLKIKDEQFQKRLKQEKKRRIQELKAEERQLKAQRKEERKRLRQERVAKVKGTFQRLGAIRFRRSK